VPSSAAVAGRSKEVVATMLSMPDRIEQVVRDADLPFAPEALGLDATTVAPADSENDTTGVHDHWIRFAHGPVTGSTPTAAAGQLGVLLG
jgi:3-hydroxyisobutyrate dehydrogenase